MRCFSVHGLFGLTSVCKQIRADTHLLVYRLNCFSFSEVNHNYGSAIRTLISTLTEREISAILSVYWPLINVVRCRPSPQGTSCDGSEPNCTDELRALKGLQKIVLRHSGSESDYIAGNYTWAEQEELHRQIAERSNEIYSVKREFVRAVAAQDMMAFIKKEDVMVECKKFSRPN